MSRQRRAAAWADASNSRWSGLALLALLVLLASVICGRPAVASSSEPYLQSKMDGLVQGGFPGAYVNDNGRTAASGVADLGTGRRARPDLTMRVGSITKSFTVTVALQLVAEHRLGLNDTVQRWLPGLLPYGRQVTLRMLMGHTSGIPDYWEAGADPLSFHFIHDPGVRDQTWTPRQLVGLIADQPLDFSPGAKAEYSDTNTIVLGLVVEKVTRRTIGSEIQNRIVRPLGLTHTVFPTTSTSLPAPFSRGYSYPLDDDGNPIPSTPIDFTEYNTSALWAMGALISNPSDLNTFYRALLGGRLLPDWLTRQAKQTVPLHQEGWPDGIGMGLGVWSWDLPCGVRVYGHEGEVPGYDTWSFASPNGSRTITMEVNLMVPASWDWWYDQEVPTYQSLWCRP